MKSSRLIIIFLVFFGAKLAISVNYASHLFCQSPEIKTGKLTSFIGDSFSYTGAMENYITNGEYYFEFFDKKVTAGRVPHYSVPYYLLRQFFDRNTSLDIFIIFQILLESIAYFLISLILLNITGAKLIFYLSLIFSCLSFYYTHYSLIPITDGPAASFLVISFWFLLRYLNRPVPKISDWIFFSVFIAIATILRPYFGFIVFFIVALLFLKYKFSFKKVFKLGLIYGGILFLLLSPWIIRNYIKSDRIMLFQQDAYAGYSINEELKLTRKMLSAIGEDASTMWDKTTAAGYFSLAMYQQSTWKVPEEISGDSILSSNFLAIRKLSVDSINDGLQNADFVYHYNLFMDRYKAEQKIKYYFLNHISRVKKFLIHSGSYYYRYDPALGCDKKINYFLKLCQTGFYYLCLFPGIIGLLLLAWSKKYFVFLLLPTLTVILVFPFAFGVIEWRYFLPFYYFHQVGLFYLLYRLIRIVKPNI